MPPREIVTNSLSNEMKHRSLAFSQKIVDEWFSSCSNNVLPMHLKKKNRHSIINMKTATKLCKDILTCLAIPKSANLTTPLISTSRFAPLISL
jgi:hypothetical protein